MFKVKETVTNNKIPITHGVGANKYVYQSKLNYVCAENKFETNG